MRLRMRPRLIPLLLLAVAALASGCDNGQATDSSDDTSAKSKPQPAVQLEPYVIAPQGREFVEGAVAGYSLDPKGDALAAIGYDETTRLRVTPGRHVIRVQVHPCNARCQSWRSVLDTIRSQREANDGSSAIADQLITCEGTFNAKPGDRFELIPTIHGSACTIEGLIEAEPEDCEPAEHATVEGAASSDDLAGDAFAFVEVDGCAVPDDVERTIAFTNELWSGQLDCNVSNGAWTLATGGELSLEPGITTLAACEASEYDLVASDLQQVDVTEDGELVFSDDAGNRVAVAAPTPT